jgi:hypothetical protein
MKRIAFLLLLALPLSATPPCPPDPCLVYPAGKFDATKCGEKSDWVAVGHIVNLKHNEQGYPFMKDFAAFTFVVDRWMKGDAGVKEIPFEVGWCRNSMEMRGDGKGSFKFWGMNKPNLEGAQWEYLHFEKLDDETKPAPAQPGT